MEETNTNIFEESFATLIRRETAGEFRCLSTVSMEPPRTPSKRIQDPLRFDLSASYNKDSRS